MKIPLWLPLILFVGWSAFSINYWYCGQWGHCGKAGTATTEPARTTSGEPLFRWNADRPEADDNFEKFKKGLIKKAGQGDTLVVTGLYRAGETAAAGGANSLGIARAKALLAMMGPEVPESRMRMEARETKDELSATSDPMPSADFSWRKMMLKKEEGAIIVADNATTILFPFNSTERDRDAKVDAYLKQLVDKHKSTNATFAVVGHTDNVDTDEINKALGQGRAQAIARILTGYGLASNRIQVASKGESEPVADNATEDGRHQNRRVVITVNQ